MMGEEALVSDFINGVTGNLVADGLKALGRKSKNAKYIRRLREKLGVDVHPVLKDISTAAIAKAIDGVVLDPQIRREFLRDKGNQALIFSWVVNPDEVELSVLNYGYTISRSDGLKLQIFARKLIRAIKEEREKALSPEARAILASFDSLEELVEEIILKQTETVLETVERTGDRTVGSVEALGAAMVERFESLEGLIIGGSSQFLSGSTNADHEGDLAKAEALHAAGRPLDARELAMAVLKTLQEGDDGQDEDLLAVNRIIANTYLAGQVAKEQKKAVPYLKEVADRAEDSSARHRNLALIALLSDDIETAVREGERAVESNATDRKSATVLANAYIASDRRAEAVTLLEEAISTSADRGAPEEHELAWVNFEAGNYQIAIEHSEAALEQDPTHVGALQIVTEAVVRQRAAGIDEGIGSVDVEEFDSIVLAEKRSSTLIDILTEQQVGALAGALFRRGLLRIWLSRESEAKDDFIRSDAMLPGSQETQRNLLTLSLILGAPEDALRYADAYEKAGGDAARAARARARAHIFSEAPELAIPELEPHLAAEANPNDAQKAFVLLVEAYDRNLQPDEAERILEKWKERKNSKGFYHLVAAERFGRLGEAEKGEADARAALEEFDESSLYYGRASIALADALYDRGGIEAFQEAAGLYAGRASVGIDDYMSRKWALSLFFAGDDPQCLRVCREIQQGKQFELFTELEATIFLRTDNFGLAAERLKWLAKKRPQKFDYAINFGVCLYRLGQPERAYQAMRLVAARVGDSPEALITLSDAYATVGKHAEAIRFSYDALQLQPNDHQFHRHYISLFMPPHVQTGEDIEEHYVKAFQQSLDEYPQRFPDHPFFERFETTPDNPELFKEQLLAVLNNPARQRLEEAFRFGNLPVGALAQISGKDIVSAWGFATSDPQYGLHLSTGDGSIELEEEGIASASEVFVADPAALLALHAVDALSTVAETLNSVLVPQAFVDELGQIVEFKRRAMKEGELSIHVEDGEVYKQEIPAEAIRRFVDFISGLRNLILAGKPFDVIGRTPGRVETFGNHTYDEQIDALGSPTTEALFEARSRNAALLSGDVTTAHVLANDENVESLGVIAALHFAWKNGAFTDEAYHDALLGLIHSNYRFIRVSPHLLARSATRYKFLITEISTRAFHTLVDRRWDADSVAGVLVNFLRWLWLDGPDGSSQYPAAIYVDGGASAIRIDWTGVVLDVLASRMSVPAAHSIVTSWKALIFDVLATPLKKSMEFDAGIEVWLSRQN